MHDSSNMSVMEPASVISSNYSVASSEYTPFSLPFEDSKKGNAGQRNRIKHVTPAQTDALLAKELNKMTMTEREEVLHDIHGVRDMMDETDELIQTSLSQLETELQKLPSKQRYAYDLALKKNPEYCKDRDFCLKFLRADSFAAADSAVRMCRYFAKQLHLFGADTLGRDITLRDLDADDMRALESGAFQLLPTRDRAGRAVMFIVMKLRVYRSRENLLRALWFTSMTAVLDIETQRKGMVVVSYNTGRDRVFDPSLTRKISRLRSCMPARVVGVHYCYDDLKLKPVLSLAMLAMGKHARARFRTHFGKHVECQYELLTFGIPHESMPVTTDGKGKTEYHMEWVKLQKRLAENSAPQPIVSEPDVQNMEPRPIERNDSAPCPLESNNDDERILPIPVSEQRQAHAQEQHQGQGQRIVVPSRLDVLFGRGRSIREHPGNLRFHNILDSNWERYESAKKFEKTAIAEEIVQMVKLSSGRFLKVDNDGCWSEVTPECARDKVSHAFRARRSLQQQQNKGGSKPRLFKRRSRQDASDGNGDSNDDSSSGGKRGAEPEKRARIWKPFIRSNSRDAKVSFGTSGDDTLTNIMESQNDGFQFASPAPVPSQKLPVSGGMMNGTAPGSSGSGMTAPSIASNSDSNIPGTEFSLQMMGEPLPIENGHFDSI